jgi:hypothetical protein
MSRIRLGCYLVWLSGMCALRFFLNLSFAFGFCPFYFILFILPVHFRCENALRFPSYLLSAAARTPTHVFYSYFSIKFLQTHVLNFISLSNLPSQPYRMATDLNLHRKTAVTSPDTAEGKARDTEVHNRERTWILCFCLDRSFSAQMGKPHSIKEE